MDLICCHVRRSQTAKEVRKGPQRRADSEEVDISALVIVRVLGAALTDWPIGVVDDLIALVEWQACDGSTRPIGRTPAQRPDSFRSLEWQLDCPGQPYARCHPELRGERVIVNLTLEELVRRAAAPLANASVAVEELLGAAVEASSGGGRGPVRQLPLLSVDDKSNALGMVMLQATLLFAAVGPSGRTFSSSSTTSACASACASASVSRTSMRCSSPSSSTDEEDDTPASMVAASMRRRWSGRLSSSETPKEDTKEQSAEVTLDEVQVLVCESATSGEQTLDVQLTMAQEECVQEEKNDEAKDHMLLNNGLPDVSNIPCFRGDPKALLRAEG